MIHLAIELGISSHEVRKTFEKYCADGSPTQKANIELLRTWLKKQKSCKDAYVLMGEGLIQVGLNIIAKEVLDYHLQKSGIALTDDLLKQLSWKLTKKDMKNLAKELGFSTQEIHKTFETFVKHCPDAVFAQNTGLLRSQDKRSTQKANYGILINWMNNQDSQEDAYVLMKDALERAGLKLIIRDVLYCGLLSDTIPTSTPTYQLLCPALTDDHLLELSLRLSGDTMIHLAIELGISSHEVRKTFEKYCADGSPTQKANIELLRTWLKKQKSCKDAYILMGEGLIQVGLNIIAKEVLDYDPLRSGIALRDEVLEELSLGS